MGIIALALDALLKAHPGLCERIMYDAGACGLDNASSVIERGMHYLMCLTASQPTLRAEAERRLARLTADKCAAHDVDLPLGGA